MRCDDKITASSPSSDSEDHEFLGADDERALEAHTSTHDVGSASEMPQGRGGVPYSGI